MKTIMINKRKYSTNEIKGVFACLYPGSAPYHAIIPNGGAFLGITLERNGEIIREKVGLWDVKEVVKNIGDEYGYGFDDQKGWEGFKRMIARVEGERSPWTMWLNNLKE